MSVAVQSICKPSDKLNANYLHRSSLPVLAPRDCTMNRLPGAQSIWLVLNDDRRYSSSCLPRMYLVIVDPMAVFSTSGILDASPLRLSCVERNQAKLRPELMWIPVVTLAHEMRFIWVSSRRLFFGRLSTPATGKALVTRKDFFHYRVTCLENQSILRMT